MTDDVTVNRPNPKFSDALEAARDLNDEPGSNPEYERGQLELIVDLFGIEGGMDSREDLAALLGWEFPARREETEPKYPEHEKLRETMQLSEFTQRLGSALDHGVLDRHENEYQLVKELYNPKLEHPSGERHIHVSNLNEALADLMGIDYDKLMAEKDAMLEEIRSLND